jgi:hypothetical protein
MAAIFFHPVHRIGLVCSNWHVSVRAKPILLKTPRAGKASFATGSPNLRGQKERTSGPRNSERFAPALMNITEGRENHRSEFAQYCGPNFSQRYRCAGRDNDYVAELDSNNIELQRLWELTQVCFPKLTQRCRR